MSSPKIEVFYLYDTTTGAPKTGVVGLVFSSYIDDTGAAVLPQPTISELGGGAYYFTPNFPSVAHGISYVINCGSVTPSYVSRWMRPEDWITDSIQTLLDVETGMWQLYTTGPNANQLILYKPDGVTVVQKFNLFDSSGSPTYSFPFKRVPTS